MPNVRGRQPAVLMESRADFRCSSCRARSRFASRRTRVRSGYRRPLPELVGSEGACARWCAALAAEILQSDFDIHIVRIPPSRMRLKGRSASNA